MYVYVFVCVLCFNASSCTDGMSTAVKERVVKAEDSRIILDISRARSAYVDIHDINLKLRQQYVAQAECMCMCMYVCVSVHVYRCV